MKRMLTIIITCCFLTLAFMVLWRSSPSQIIQTQVLEEVPFHTGFADSLYQLFSPRFITESRVCFCEIKDHRVMIVDGNSGEVVTIGRFGSGPGEFSQPSALAVWPGRGFVVFDSMRMRISLFDEMGGYQTAYSGMFAPPMSSPQMYAIDDNTLAILPRDLPIDYPITNNVILMPGTLDSTQQFSVYDGIPISTEDNPKGYDLSIETVGAGANGTILVAYHSDYRIRRYSRTGDLLWDSGSLDETFRPPSLQLPTREGDPTMDKVFNSVEAIAEIKGYGFATGIWAFEGSNSGGLANWFIDLRNELGELVTRIPIPIDLRIGDFYQNGNDLYILAYRIGHLNLPTIRVFKIDLEETFK